MKQYVFTILLCAILNGSALAQNVGINPGGTTPNSSAILDLNTGNTFTGANGKGLLIPNVTLTSTTDATTIGTGNVTSLLVYNTTAAGVGATAVTANTYYYWNGAKWVSFTGQGGNDWSLTGNAGTTVGTNFLGTTDNVDLQFNVNNARAGLINIAQSQTFFGSGAGVNTTAAGTLNSFFGTSAGLTNAGGSANTAFGYSALRNNSTAGDNTMVGVDAGYYLNASYNTSVGMWSLEGSSTVANNTGVANTALGFCAGGGYNGVPGAGSNNYLQTTSGSYNTFLGYSTAMSAGTYSNTTTVGAFAEAGANDVVILGGVSGTNGCTTSPKVGIGTMTPAASLEVVETGASSPRGIVSTQYNASSIGARVILRKARGTSAAPTAALSGDNTGLLVFGSYDGSSFIDGATVESKTTENWSPGLNGTSIIFTNTATGSTGRVQRMIIDQNGNVGIATGAPTAVLSVNGAANNTTGVWAIFSDARIKNVDADFKDGLAIIKKINPVKFTYNSKAPFRSSQQQIGVVAQELEKIAPYMVSQKEFEQYKDLREVNGQAYTFLLINAVKELDTKSESQQKIIDQQKTEIELMKERLAVLEKLVNAATAKK